MSDEAMREQRPVAMLRGLMAMQAMTTPIPVRNAGTMRSMQNNTNEMTHPCSLNVLQGAAAADMVGMTMVGLNEERAHACCLLFPM